MKRTYTLNVGILIFILSLLIFPLSGLTYADDEPVNPSQEFISDFFSALQGSESRLSSEQSAVFALRRLLALRDLVNKNDLVSAWQVLINLPDLPETDTLSSLKHDALALHSIIPWYSDKELRDNFLDAFNEIWLKNDKLDDPDTFREVFSGYASRRTTSNPAVFIRDNLGFYGYVKSPRQPSDDISFIHMLFSQFSLIADLALKSGMNYRNMDLTSLSNQIIRDVSQKIDDAYRYASNRDLVRRGITSIDDQSATSSEIKTLITDEFALENKPETSTSKKPDFAKINIFKLPPDADPKWTASEESPREIISFDTDEETEKLTAEASESLEEPQAENIDISLEKLGGLEPPEPPSHKPSSKVIKIPKIDETNPTVDIPSNDDDKTKSENIVEETEIGKTIPEPQSVEDKNDHVISVVPVESAFKQPEIKVIDPYKQASDEKPKPVKIPKIQSGQKNEETPTPKSEETQPINPEQKETSEEIDLLAQKPSSPDNVFSLPKEKPEETQTQPPVVQIPKIEKPENEPSQPSTEAITSQSSQIESVHEIKIPPETPKPVTTQPMVSTDEEIKKIATEFTDRILQTGNEIGRIAIDLVILWSNGPEKVKDYVKVEDKLMEQFRNKKEEFLTMLFISDYFKLEEELGMTFDTFNGRIIDSMMKGYEEFKANNGFADNPNVTEEELLRAIAQLTDGVQSRQESYKIKNSALRAFRVRRSQFKEIITKLENLKSMKIDNTD